jgi:hypothetical protein
MSKKSIADLLLEVNGKPLKPVSELKKAKAKASKNWRKPIAVLCIATLAVYFIKEFYYG